MKGAYFTLMLVFLLGCGGDKQQENTSNDIFPYDIHQEKFSNGLQTVTVPYESPGIVSLFIIVRAGSREEVEPGKTGFAHFFEHMMFRGTKKYSPDDYNAVLKSIGASANANTWLDRTVYHITGNAEMIEKMFEVESDRFMNLDYSVHGFKTEAGAVKGEYTKNAANPFEQLEEKTADTAFTRHTYKHTTIGFWEDVVDMPNQYEYSLKFFDRFYRPEYTTILVVGDITPEKVNTLTRQYFGDWKMGNYNPDIPAEPAQQGTRYAHVQAENFPPYISLNYKSPAFNPDSRDNAALSVIGQILFSHKSDLYRKLVIQKGICRDLSNTYYFTRDPYLYSIGASLKKAEDLQYVKDEITGKISDLRKNGVDPKELDDAKSHMKYSYANSINSSSSIANSLSYYIWVTGDPNSLNKYYRQIDKLTVKDLQDVADKYLKAESLTISTISPEEKGGVS